LGWKKNDQGGASLEGRRVYFFEPRSASYFIFALKLKNLYGKKTM